MHNQVVVIYCPTGYWPWQSQEKRAVITVCSKNAFHVDNWLMFLAHLLRDILTVKFQSEQFLPTASKKFWINPLPNLFSLYSSFLFFLFTFPLHTVRLLELPRSILSKLSLCYYKSFRSFILTYFMEYCWGISFLRKDILGFSGFTLGRK